MAIKQFKPYTPGRRFMTVQDKTEISRTPSGPPGALNRTGEGTTTEELPPAILAEK